MSVLFDWLATEAEKEDLVQKRERAKARRNAKKRLQEKQALYEKSLEYSDAQSAYKGRKEIRDAYLESLKHPMYERHPKNPSCTIVTHIGANKYECHYCKVPLKPFEVCSCLIG